MSASEPTLSSLFAEERGLRLTCNCRGTARVMSPAEACASYGALLKFSEVRAVLQARCKASPCKMIVEPTAHPFKHYKPNGEHRSGSPR